MGSTLNFDTFSKEEAQKRLDFQLEIIVETLKQNGFTNIKVEERKDWGKVAKFMLEDPDVEENNCEVFVSSFRYNKPTKQYALDVYIENYEYSCNRHEIFIPVSEENIRKYNKYVEEHPDSYLHRI